MPKNTAWWKAEPLSHAQATALDKAVDQIENLSRGRRSDDVHHMRMYGNRDMSGLGREVRWRESDKQRLRYNLTQAVINAYLAQVAKLRPRPRILTDRGKWKERKQAEAMEQAIDGEFYRNDIDEIGPEVELDAAVTGTGFFRVHRDGSGFPKIERAYPLEVLVDPRDGFYGKPKTIYHVHAMDRETVLDMAKAMDARASVIKAIENAKLATRRSFPFMVLDSSVDQIMLVEAYRSANPKGENGMYVQAVQGQVLVSQEWNRGLPYLPRRWKKRQQGFWGSGIVEELKPMQVEINYTLEKIQYILHNVSTVRHWIQGGGKIKLKAEQMTNTPGEILTYYGPNPPTTDVVNAVPRELFQHVQDQIAAGFNQIGISQFAATSQKPAGLNSGEAIRAFEDVGSARFVLNGRGYEQVHMDVGKELIAVKNDIANDDDEDEKPVIASVRGPRGETVRTIKWGDVKLDEDQYIMKVLPQSALPGTPVGRIATVEGWIASGLIDPAEGKELIDMPDLKTHQTLESAVKDNILSAISEMIDEGNYVTPEPMMDLQLALGLVASAYNRARWEGVPEERLEMLTRFNDDIVAMQEDAAQQAAAAQAGLAAPGLPQQGVAAEAGLPGAPPELGAALPQGAVAAPDQAAA